MELIHYFIISPPGAVCPVCLLILFGQGFCASSRELNRPICEGISVLDLFLGWLNTPPLCGVIGSLHEWSCTMFCDCCKKSSPGFAVKGGRICGWGRAYARPHPQIRVSTTEIPEEPKTNPRLIWTVGLFLKQSHENDPTASQIDAIC